MPAVVGVDLGGTNTRVALIQEGEFVKIARFPTQAQSGAAELITRLSAVINAMADLGRQRGEEPVGLGVASPGVIDRQRGVVLFSPNLPGFGNLALAYQLSQACGLPTFLENDANLFALGEHRFGAGRGESDLVCLTLGTGVGGGLIVDSRLAVGPLGCGGEIGHTLVEPGGRLCGCGARGCLEAYASATGLTGMLREEMARGRRSLMGPQDEVTRMAQAALRGDALGRELFGLAGRALGRAVANLVATTGLKLVIIGGGVAPAWPLMEPACRREMEERLRIVDHRQVRLVTAELEERAPLLGAAAFALDGLNN